MRSIRRSLLGYLLVLVALALGGVVVFVDRFADAAITAREEAEVKRIEQVFEVRRADAKAKFDADLVIETKSLAKELQYRLSSTLGQGQEPRRGGSGGRPSELPPRVPEPPVRASDEEAQEYRLRAGLLQTAPPIFGGRMGLTTVAVDPRRAMPPGWLAFDAPRVLNRIQESLRKTFDDDEHPGYFQFHLVAFSAAQPTRLVVVVRPARLGHDLSLDPAWLERNQDVEYRFDDIELPGHGTFRRVVTATTHGRPLFFPLWLSPPPPTNPSPRPGGPRGPDLFARAFVHHARPYSELDTRLGADQQNRDEQLERVRGETRTELTRLRTRLGMIGLGSFAALVIGGWFIVARGLAPIRKLSDAVSRVSEKDFRLPVRQDELSGELVPILARLTQTLDLLRRAFAREKQAVADISHELRTPIASLLATIDVSLRKPRTPDQYRATLEDCRAIARQLGQLVERIMTLATLDAGNARTAVTRADAADLAAGCARTIRPLAEHHGLTFALHAPAEPVELDTDPDKLREVLMNLLHNAVEYNRPGGRVELAVRRDAGTAVFEVRDTGIGMLPDVRDRIFERFYRADPSRHATGVHAGLGLAIVKEYVDRLGGTITVDSTPDEGSTFRVTVPAAPPLEPDAPAEDARPDPRARGEVAPTGS